ncbi:restriction endonuclease subunit S [Helicobacter pylori]|uniref:restriction endonuclease subunit S n=1 Tax=Helicobacter pylori TaxID=210 RepID=UPI00273A015F|nr:restriction endonuclease subunit S [Helicobacter pylori]
MNQIERLLHTLAPKGVEFKKIGELFKRNKGINITAAQMKELHSEIGKVRIFAGGATKANINYKDISQKDIINCESVIIKSRGNIGFEYYNQPFSHKNEIWSYSSKTNQMLVKFLYYYLSNNQDYFQKLAQSSSVKLPQLSVSDTDEYEVPVPPLEIQQEIVKILDAFTELNTELNARKKQYQYYQNMLLDFDDINQNRKDAKEKLAQKPYPKRLKTLLHTLAPKGVEFRKLGDIGEFYGGLVGKSKKSFSQGNKFYVPYVNVFNNPQLDLNALESVQIGDKEKQNTIQLGDVLFTGSSENLEDCAMSCVVTQKIEKDIYLNSFCFGFRFFDKNLFNPSFLKHFLRDYNFRKNISKVANGVTRFNVSKQLLSQITIPIPPLEIQQEIVKILDQFSALTTDLLAGIPAEIKARKKQYEYYREKLLTFKPLTPNKEVDKA